MPSLRDMLACSDLADPVTRLALSDLAEEEGEALQAALLRDTGRVLRPGRDGLAVPAKRAYLSHLGTRRAFAVWHVPRAVERLKLFVARIDHPLASRGVRLIRRSRDDAALHLWLGNLLSPFGAPMNGPPVSAVPAALAGLTDRLLRGEGPP